MNISVRGTLCGLVESVELEGDDTRVRGREIYRPCRVELSQLYLEEASGTDRLLAGAPGWGSWRPNQSLEQRADNMENTQYDLNNLPVSGKIRSLKTVVCC